MSSANKTLADWLDFISSTHPSEIELGLERVKSVFSKLNLNARPKLTVVVGGTNGKGSTIAMTEAALASVGIKVGAYSSPHIINYNERVRVLGKDVEDFQLVEAFEAVDIARGNIPLTYFEFGTLAAFYILFNSHLDVVLLEVGLGGRLDAVNVVDNDISIITSVDFDHTDWLGNSLSEIASEKAGILRKERVFIGGRDLPPVVNERADDLNCLKYICDKDFYEFKGEVVLSAEGGRFAIPLPVSHLPRSNVLVAMQCCLVILERLNRRQYAKEDLQKCKTAIEHISIPGRLENVPGRNIFLDVAHNPQAARHLTSFMISESKKGNSTEVLFSALCDKDIESIVSIISPYVDKWHIAELKVERSASLSSISGIVRERSSNVETYASIESALQNWVTSNSENEEENESKNLVVFGSFYTVEAAKRFLMQ